MKKRYLIVHDYGMGGVWGVMTARSGREICQKYPEVKILEVRPAWMSDANYNNILSNNSFDIDDEPRGWLARLGNP
jgi:hypothetical protein